MLIRFCPAYKLFSRELFATLLLQLLKGMYILSVQCRELHAVVFLAFIIKYCNFKNIYEQRQANFVKQTFQVSEETKRLAFQKNRFDASEYTQSNQNKQREGNASWLAAENVESILDAAKLLCQIRPVSLVWQNSPLLIKRDLREWLKTTNAFTWN